MTSHIRKCACGMTEHSLECVLIWVGPDYTLYVLMSMLQVADAHLAIQFGSISHANCHRSPCLWCLDQRSLSWMLSLRPISGCSRSENGSVDPRCLDLRWTGAGSAGPSQPPVLRCLAIALLFCVSVLLLLLPPCGCCADGSSMRT